MLHLPDSHLHANEPPHPNGSYIDGPLAVPPATLTRTVAAPEVAPSDVGDVASDRGIPEASVLLAGLLLLRRNNTEDQDLGQFSWGYVSRDGTDSVLPLPDQCASPSQAYLDPYQTISSATTLLNKALGRDGSDMCPKLGNGQTLFFTDADASLVEKMPLGEIDLEQKTHLGSMLTLSPQKWTFRLELSSLDEQLCLQARWQGPLLTREVVEQSLDTLIDLLHLVVQRPEAPVREALGPLERDLEQIWTWNADLPAKIDVCVHDMVSDYAAQRPDAPAVSAWDGEFTYGQVEALSSRLAADLVALGVALGTPVPLCFEKSRWTVVAVLAVMKAGGTFVLTDPSQPQARLQTIVEQTRARVVVSSKLQEDLAGRISPGGQVLVVSDALLERGTGATEQPPIALPSVPADTPMYIIFTSGSTGKPKGVVISHANYTSGALPRAEAVGYRKDLRVFEFASYAFDVSIDCMLCTLVTGGCICVPSDEDRMNDLSGAIRRSGAKMAHMTPSVARVLDPDILPSLEVLGLGGEAVSAGDAVSWSKHTSVIIAYGPSECTVGCTINNNISASKAYTNIGKGVGGLTWIADPADHNNLVPIGAVGELLVEGPVVGIGYLDDPEKTAEGFIEDPPWLLAGHGSVPGRSGRLYKTGDLVSYDSDGSGAVFFVGRKDQQVKIRGQRVELVEIEHHLHDKVPAGVKTVAEVIKPGGGDPTLVVFLEEGQPADGSLPEGDAVTLSPALSQALPEIDAALGEELPRYMVPTAYIPLATIPSLVSGKTDRKKLRELGASMTRQQVASFRVVADKSRPETESERALHGIWTQLLGTTGEISLSDSFFALGGDSLKAMKLVAAARAEGISLTVASIFTHPTLRDMAATAQKASTDTETTSPPFSLLDDGWTAEAAKEEAARLCDIDESTVEDIYPCTPLQEALMALSAKIEEAYVAQRVLDLKDLDTAQKLQAAFEMAADDCPILRTRIIQVPGRGLVQVVVKEKIQWKTANSLQEYLDQDRTDHMGLGKHLVRYGLVSDSSSEKISFVLTIHHSLYDGWSMPLVIDRVNRAYQGLSTHRPAAFKDFIHFLNKLDRGACEDFWREHLHGATGPQFPPLPWEGYQARADSLLELFVPLVQRPASNTTVATVIRGAWGLVASNYTACDDVVFGETLTGRNAPISGVDQIEGPMITTVPVRVQVDRTVSVAEYLQAIHDQTVAQIPYEHTGLQHIRRLSDDALQACELRTGLVLHPGTDGEEDLAAPVDDNQPANGLVPAGDAEAAQEALKFNTYSIMLVCSLSPKGFLVMASFDSKTVDKQTMETVLDQFGLVSRQLCEGTDKCINDIEYLTEADGKEIRRVSAISGANVGFLGDKYKDITAAWIVDPADPERLLPRGAVGELIVETRQEEEEGLDLPTLEKPKWLLAQSADETHPGRLVRTDLLAKFEHDGSLVKIGSKNASTAKSAKVPKAKPTAVTAASNKQKSLRNLWSRVLRMDEDDISLGDNFFRLGGDSITAMKLVSEARLDGFELSVAQVFANRSLFDMANALQGAPAKQAEDAPVTPVTPFSLLEMPNVEEFVEQSIRPRLADRAWKIADVLPVRPLQEIAIKGTVDVPRYSMRYEMLHFDCPIDGPKLLRACQEVVARNEILRTVFTEVEGTYFGVVLDQLLAPTTEYDVQDDVEAFVRKVCEVDVQERTTLGSSFVKFFLVHGADGGKSSLIFRISHAQYDEMCLPIFLHQLSALYEDRPVPESTPFSAFVHHVVRDNVPQGIAYWRDLLEGSALTVLRPDIPLTARRHHAIQHTVDISARPRDVTVATLPTAAWALCLSRRLGLRDVTFGEVVSGRNMSLPGGAGDAVAVAGPCWQYAPVRVRMAAGWTGADLLEAVQHQHIASSRFEGMALPEVVRLCGTGWPADTDWFDSVVHQDVEHVEDLPFLEARCRTETLYLHEEPLREWKVQAFPQGDSLTLEIVTFESWAPFAEELLRDLTDAMETLVRRPWEAIVIE
ncbi:hypothetical protein QBC33DRAFT_585288 [Phialemonium atrogriseum]|uniref:Brevianamide F synthase n=1 Tax=Phialemonium atrogriseum TaxID=1093897 RepID=A0AAJ0C1L1_9PEZI|nr:uncharacterized protein QBC33DRAFT_585288 [Phialemonium atrogriseum]KAK1768250.1 hypothetical protein QBC33DRAFT_585288 [Phialemonium atrogriseum]